MGDYAQLIKRSGDYVSTDDRANELLRDCSDAIETLTRERDDAIKTNNNLAIENIRLSSECETLRHVCEVSSGTQYTLEATEEKLDFAKLEIDRLMQDVATERHSASVSDEVCVAEMQARKAAEADRDAAVATLTRELADAKAECEGVASEAAKMLTEYLETRDAAIARAEAAETATFNAVANCAIYRMERDALRALLREAGEKIGPFVKLKPVSWSLEGDHYYVKTVAIRALADLAARISAATHTETGGDDERN